MRGRAGPGSRRFDRNGGTPDAIEPVTNGQLSPEWGGSGRSAAEEAVNAARTPRFTPLNTENGDAATTAGFPAVNASWDDPLTKSSGNAWENGKPTGTGWRRMARPAAAPGWDDPAAKRRHYRPGAKRRTRTPARPGMMRQPPASWAGTSRSARGCRAAAGRRHRAASVGVRQRWPGAQLRHAAG